MEERQRVSEKFKLCQWDIKRADSAGQTQRERQERDRERQRDMENDKDTRRIQRSTEY